MPDNDGFMSNETLDYFGKVLIEHVRDHPIWRIEGLLDGTLKGDTAKTVTAWLKQCPPHTKEAIKALLPEIVDTCLHDFLVMLEEHPEIKVSVDSGSDVIEDINEACFRLCGELCTEDGWIGRFSRYPLGVSETDSLPPPSINT